MAGRYSNPNVQYLDENGNPLSGGSLGFFESGTSTPLNTYSDDALSIANTNPVVLDDAGRAGDIFLLNQNYKVVLSDFNGAVVWTADPVLSAGRKSSEVRNVSTTTQLDSSDDGKWIAADATAGGFTITLPPVADVGNGYQVTVQKVDSSSNVVTVDGSGSETINGNSDAPLDLQYQALFELRSDGTQWLIPLESGRDLPPNHIDGLLITEGAAPTVDIQVSSGSARSDDDSADIVLANDLTKKLNSAFAEGNNQGCLDTGTVAADTDYDIYVISKADGTADVLATTKGSGPALPSGFTNKRFIGRRATDGSSNIIENMVTQQRVDGQYYEADLDASGGTTLAAKAFPTGPDQMEVAIRALQGVTNNVQFQMQIGGDTSLDTSGYDGIVSNFTSTANYSSSFILVINLASNRETSGMWNFRKTSRNGRAVALSGGAGQASPGNTSYISAGSKDLETQDLTQALFLLSSGDFSNGNIYVTAFKAGAYAP